MEQTWQIGTSRSKHTIGVGSTLKYAMTLRRGGAGDVGGEPVGHLSGMKFWHQAPIEASSSRWRKRLAKVGAGYCLTHSLGTTWVDTTVSGDP